VKSCARLLKLLTAKALDEIIQGDMDRMKVAPDPAFQHFGSVDVSLHCHKWI
jgi:hypothetical protein